MRKGIALSLGLLLAGGIGGTTVAAPAQPTDAQVRQLMEVFGVARMLSQMNTQMAGMMRQQLPCVPGSYWQGFVDANGTKELTDRMVPIYQRHFTAEDIEGLLKFYRSPLGQKVITQMPATMAEGMQIGQEWGRQRAQAMIGDLQKKGTINTQGRCPAAPGAAAPGAVK